VYAIISFTKGEQPFAAKCVTEMLNSNMELQETKIGKREISIFVEKLRKSEMNPMYLDLIKVYIYIRFL